MNHMLKCSAASVAHTNPPPEKAPVQDDVDTKPAAKPQSLVSSATTTEDGISSGKSEIIPLTAASLHCARKSGSYGKPKSPTASLDTLPTANTTVDDLSSAKSTLSITASTHLLAQTWWRPNKKVARQSTGVSIPFNLEHCVTVIVKEENVKPERASKRLRARSQSRHETLQVACPICKKAFSGGMILTEEAMSRHVERCSRTLLEEKGHGSQLPISKNSIMENIAIVNALSRVRNESKTPARKTTMDHKQAHAAAWAERRASVKCLQRGPGKRALDNLILGYLGPTTEKNNGS
jgi:hypothetical protein